MHKNLAIREDMPSWLRSEDKPSMWYNISRWFMGFLLLGAIIAVILHFSEFAKLFQILKEIKPQWILFALLSQSLSYVCAASVWYEVLKYSKHRVHFKSLFSLSLAQLFAEQALPSGGLSGAILVIRGLINRGILPHVGFGCMLIGMVSYYISYLIAVLLAVAVLATHDAVNGFIITVTIIFSFVAVGIPALVLWLKHLNMKHIPKFIRRFTASQALLQTLADSPSHLLKNPQLMLKTILLQFSIFLVDATTLWIMLHAVGYTTSPAIVFASFVIASVAATIGPLPLGIGTFEGVCVTMLHLFGIPVEAALIGTLLLRSFTFWLPMLPGLFIIRREMLPWKTKSTS